MPIQRALALLFVTALLLCAAATPGTADTSMAPSPGSMMAAPPVPSAHDLVRVTACNPALNLNQSGGWVGYSPGYYPAGPYRWGDAYGASYYQPPVTTTNPQLGIDYANISPKTMTHIEFGLVANGVLLAEVHDVGKFTTNAEIKHKFGISQNVFPIRTGLPQCVPLRITFVDGTKWRNPKLPPKNTNIYYHP